MNKGMNERGLFSMPHISIQPPRVRSLIGNASQQGYVCFISCRVPDSTGVGVMKRR